MHLDHLVAAPRDGFEEREEALLIHRAAADVRVDLHAHGSELVERALDFGDRIVDIVERDGCAEALEPVGVVGDELGHSVVRDARELRRAFAGPEVVERRGGGVDDLPIVGAELIHDPEAFVHVDEGGYAAHALLHVAGDRAVGDGEQPLGVRRRQQVAKSVDLHRGGVLPPDASLQRE